VPGPQQTLYVLGRQMLKAFPYVPLGARSVLASPSSPTTGRSTFGVTGDYDSVPDIDLFCLGIEDAMKAMLKAAAEASD